MTISPEVLAAMVCPTCQSDVFRADVDIRCTNGHVMHVANGIVDARLPVVDEATERTFASFGYEWTAFGDVTTEELRFWDRYFKDVPAEALAGSLAADIGCGKGRYSRVTAGRVAQLVALDGSDAVHSAARNMADLDNVVVVKADLNHAPLRPGAFDFVSCLGVLHHLGDPRRGFEKVSSLVGLDGWLLLYLYSRDEAKSLRSTGLAVADRLRRLTVRIPHRTLRILCYPLAMMLYALLVLPGTVGEATHVSVLSRLPLNGYRRQRLRVLWLDTFDRMSAPIETRYMLSEVAGWFVDAGLDIVSVDEEYGLMIVARRLSG